MYGNESHAIEQKLLGAWKLISITLHDIESGITTPDDTYGANPTGFLQYTNGRMLALMTQDNRSSPSKNMTPDEAFYLMNSMISYGGTYTIEENKIIHHVDVSWNQRWTGTDQVRVYRFEKDYLILTTPPFHDPKTGKAMTFNLTWKKIS